MFPCDVSDRESVKKLAEYAAGLGDIKVVVHAAGVSPHMGTPAEIFAINARGTINIDEEFGSKMDGGCILNVASMAAYMLPENMNSMKEYQLCFTDFDALQTAIVKMVDAAPAEQQTGMAYSLSKRFVIWLTQQMAIKLGKRASASFRSRRVPS